MADFARLGLAAKIPNFMETYATNIEVGSQAAVEASPLAAGILSLLEAHNGYWQGTSTELVRKLQELDPTSREFQKLSARSVGKKLASSLKGDLTAVGVAVDQEKGNRGQRSLTLRKVSQEQRVASHAPQTPTPVLDKEEEEQSPPIALPSVTPEQNNGVAVPTTPEEKKTPVAATVNGRVHNTEGRVTVSSPPTTSTQTGLPVSPLDNGNGHNPHNSHSLDSAEIGLPLAHEGIPPWLWEG
jgi:hypothetical protein